MSEARKNDENKIRTFPLAVSFFVFSLARDEAEAGLVITAVILTYLWGIGVLPAIDRVYGTGVQGWVDLLGVVASTLIWPLVLFSTRAPGPADALEPLAQYAPWIAGGLLVLGGMGAMLVRSRVSSALRLGFPIGVICLAIVLLWHGMPLPWVAFVAASLFAGVPLLWSGPPSEAPFEERVSCVIVPILIVLAAACLGAIA